MKCDAKNMTDKYNLIFDASVVRLEHRQNSIPPTKLADFQSKHLHIQFRYSIVARVQTLTLFCCFLFRMTNLFRHVKVVHTEMQIRIYVAKIFGSGDVVRLLYVNIVMILTFACIFNDFVIFGLIQVDKLVFTIARYGIVNISVSVCETGTRNLYTYYAYLLKPTLFCFLLVSLLAENQLNLGCRD